MFRLLPLLGCLFASASVLAASKPIPVEHPVVNGLRLGMEVRDFVGAFSAQEHDLGVQGVRVFFVSSGGLPSGVKLVRCDFKDGKLAYAEALLVASTSRAKTWAQFIAKPVSDHGDPKTPREVVGESSLTSALLDESAAWADSSTALVYGRSVTTERNYVVAVAARAYKELPAQLSNAWAYNSAIRDFGRSFTPAGVFASEMLNTGSRLVEAIPGAVIPRKEEAEYVRRLKDSFQGLVAPLKSGWSEVGVQVKAGQMLAFEAADPGAAKGRVSCRVGREGKPFDPVAVSVVAVAEGGEVYCSTGRPGLLLALVAYPDPGTAITREYGAAPADETKSMDVQSARLDVRALETAIDLYEVKHSRLPVALTDLVPAELKTVRRDPWGHPYIYTRTFERYSVTSLGPDGLPGGGDDVSTGR